MRFFKYSINHLISNLNFKNSKNQLVPIWCSSRYIIIARQFFSSLTVEVEANNKKRERGEINYEIFQKHLLQIIILFSKF